MTATNVDDLVAVDMHVHAEVSAAGHRALPEHLLSGSAADFPDLRIVIAHPSFPWQDEALAVAKDRWLADFDRLDLKPAVRPLILKENAVRLLGLAGSGDA
jgi:predicted TIM-barrel fold metal-dependent hydrolase